MIGYQGLPGAYSYLAAKAYFGEQAPLRAYPRFRDVFEAVATGAVSAGIVPIENSLAGPIFENVDALRRSDTAISAEVYLPIVHCLLVSPVIEGGDAARRFGELRRVIAHPQALEQCAHFFERHPTIVLESCSNNAVAAERVAREKRADLAAIASKEAARIYDLSALLEGIQDEPNNTTRFVVISPRPANSSPALSSEPQTGKCSLAFRLPHVAGSLLKVLAPLTEVGCNMTKIESRPIPQQPFEYYFFLDFEYPSREARDEVLSRLKGVTLEVWHLGSYARGRECS